MMLIQTIRFLWPFLKEMILGDKSLVEALRYHFGRVLVMAVIVLSIALNFFTIPKLLALSYDHVELKRNYAALIKQRYPNTEVDVVVEPAARAQPNGGEQYRASKEFFERLSNKEQHRTR